MKVTKILLIFLFFTLPLVHGRVFQTLGFDFGFIVSGNFEFTKALYFNIFCGIIFLSFSVEYIISYIFQKKLVGIELDKKREKNTKDISSIFLCIFIIISVSTILSISPFHSLIGDTEKGHTALMFFNLLGVFFILRKGEKEFLYTLIQTSVISGIFVSILAIKEYLFPSFDYGQLSNRALGSFGHPNYLSGYLLLLSPFFINAHTIFTNKHIILSIKTIGIMILLLAFLWSKSFWGIFIIILYCIYNLYSFLKNTTQNTDVVFKLFISVFLFLGSIGGGILLVLFFPEKLHSFLSRFYLWQTTLSIIFSDIKIILFGAGSETLPYFFNSYKVPELYIFENFGFTADRPHNFILNIFYHFGFFGVSILFILIYKFLRSLKGRRISPIGCSIIFFLIFGIFQYFSVTSYLFIILCITLYISHTHSISKYNFYSKIIFGSLVIFSLFGGYVSLKLYQSEILYKNNNTLLAQENFSHPKYLINLGEYVQAASMEKIISPYNIKNHIAQSYNKQLLCDELVVKYPSSENYFYCGNIFEKLGNDDVAKTYYQLGLRKLPDLWNINSRYWNNYFVKHTITGNRFFSPKFGDIGRIVEKYSD